MSPHRSLLRVTRLEDRTVPAISLAFVGNFGPVNEGSSVLLIAVAQDNSAGTFYGFDFDNNGTWDQFSITGVVNYAFPDNGEYQVNVVAGDNTGALTFGSTVVTVMNVPPTITGVGSDATTIDRGGTVTLNGTVSDPGWLDTHTITVDWGDGSAAEAVGVDPATRSFTTTHQYLANPSGTATDDFTITATATDKDGSVSPPVTIDVRVVTPPPVVDGLAIPPVVEGQTATLTGTIADTGANDRFTVAVDWDGDGADDETFADVRAGAFAFTHVYANEAGVPVRATVTNVAGSTQVTASLDVANAVPTVTFDPVSGVTEGGTATLTGTVSDAGVLDSHTVVIDWGDGSEPTTLTLAADGRTFSASHQYLDDLPGGPAAVSVVVTDDGGAAATAGTTVAIANADPTAAPLAGPATAFTDEAVTFSTSVADVGTLDVLTAAWDFGDGTTLTEQVDRSGPLTALHMFDAAGTYTVRLTVRDGDGGEVILTTTVTITDPQPPPPPPADASADVVPDPLGGTALVVRGTAGDDTILISRYGSLGLKVTVNGVCLGTFAPTNRIVVHGLAGNDFIKVAEDVGRSAWLYGGDGNDILMGGHGTDVLLGGAGNDLLAGRDGRDLLIGGAGADVLLGGDSGDLQIGGGTVHDADEANLAQVQAVWTSSAGYQARLLALRQGLLGLGSITDDAAVDILHGGAGRDWFMGAANDVVLGRSSDEAFDQIPV